MAQVCCLKKIDIPPLKSNLLNFKNLEKPRFYFSSNGEPAPQLENNKQISPKNYFKDACCFDS